ncbi:MAG: type VI secretion system Vgr family protein [Bacteroidota bacterium]
MATNSSFLKIDLQGTEPVTIVSQLLISQSIDHHHHFEIHIPAEALEGKDEPMISKTKSQIGAAIAIHFGENLFKGIVTHVSVAKYGNSQGDIIIKGFGPTIIMDDRPNCVSFEKKGLQQIVNTVTTPYPKNILDVKIKPSYKKSIEYLVQYKENSYRFLKRLAQTFGEWFYYDGEDIYFGKPSSSKQVELYFGKDLFSFEMSMDLSPISFELITHDYIKNASVKSSASDIHSNVSASFSSFDYLAKTFDTSKKIFAFKGMAQSNYPTVIKEEMADLIRSQVGASSAEMIKFKGVSNNSSLKIGSVISVSGKMGSKNYNVDSYGKYIIIDIIHTGTASGDYQNHFTAIPSVIEIPPKYASMHTPKCESQTAVVTDNKDPEGIGRVRVRFTWQQNPAQSPWIRCLTAHGGKERGMYFVPEIDDEVIVGFQNDDADQPFVMGSAFHGKANSSDMKQNKNFKKAIRTISGNSIVYNDENGKEEIKIYNKDEQNIISLSLEGGKKIKIQSEGDIELTAKKNIKLTAEKDIIMVANGKQTISAKQGIEANGTTKIEMKATKIALEAQSKAEIKAAQISAEASAKLELKASAMAELNGGSMTNVKGAMVMIN